MQKKTNRHRTVEILWSTGCLQATEAISSLWRGQETPGAPGDLLQIIGPQFKPLEYEFLRDCWGAGEF